jgi:LysM repeat protein
VRIAVISIVALHAVFFGGLLLLGCNQKPSATALSGGITNTVPTNDLASLTGSPYAGFTTTTNLPAASNVWAGQPTNWPAPATNVESVAAPAEPVLAATAGTDYKVKAGDTPARIAKAHGVSLDALMQANPGLEPRRLQVNQTIHIPGSSPRSGGATAAATETNAEAGEATSIHEVKAGENLTRIAKKHGVTVKAIRQANGLKSDRISVGQKLKIPAAKLAARTVETPAPAPAAAPASNPNPPIAR